MTGQERPWDPPLTEEGVEQGAALGAGLKEHCERLGLPPVTRVISSPLTRCLQTAAAAARSLGLREICVEPSLTEGMLEEWYRSWAVPGADSTWGGPIHARCGVPLPEGAKLFPGATGPASSLLFGPAEAQEALRRHGVSDVGVSSEYEALNPSGESFTQCWDHFETESALADRMQTTLEALGRRYPDETILLCSHGGPCAKAYGRLLGTRAQKLNAGYTALCASARCTLHTAATHPHPTRRPQTLHTRIRTLCERSA
jgi:broad specificity phosphatase PhoE